MKNTLKSILALAMVICMLFTIAGCGDANTDASSEQVSDDFFSETVSIDDTTSTESSSGKNENTTSTQSPGKDNSSKVTTTVPKDNIIAGKSWNEVLAGMPKKLRGSTVVMYNWNPANEYTGAPAVMDKFTQQTGIKVDWRTIPYAQYTTKLAALIATEENIPDMVRSFNASPSWIQNYQDLSVTKYDFKDAAWDKEIMELYTFNGKTYLTSLQNTHIGSVALLFYNKDLIDKYDYEDPYKLWKAGKWNWDKYIKMCKAAMKDGIPVGAYGEGHFPAYLSSWGISGTVSFDGKKFTSNWLKKDFLKVHQTLGDLYNKDAIFGFGGEEHFSNASSLFYIGTAVHARKKNSYFGALKATNSLYFVPIPKHPELKKYYQGHGEAEAYGVPKGAKNPTAVPYFLRFFLDGANYELSTYFGNEQNLEVYNWCMNQKNKVYSYGYQGAVGSINEKGIQLQTGAQMKSFIDANKGSADKMVKDYNETLKKIK